MTCKLPHIQHKLELSDYKIIHSGWHEIWKTKGVIRYDTDPQEVSEEFELDLALNKFLDAVVIVPYSLETEPHIYLTSCFRPTKDFCSGDYLAFPEEVGIGNTWELPAGAVEPEESKQLVKGYKMAAARELKEETGLVVNPDEMSFLGKRVFSGTGGERLFFLDIEIKNENKVPVIGDGHPLEKHTQTFKISIEDALNHILSGYLTDAKTEIGIYRLCKKLKRKIF
jgi:8-oxo-dGTP pyrophosphatase MutT (NUDIX family)